MDYLRLLEKKSLCFNKRKLLSDITENSYSQAFEIEYTHNSTAIEGNTLTLIETKLLLADKISVGGKDIRELYEVINHNKAFRLVKQAVAEKLPLSEKIIKDIHAMLMENIIIGGIYRNVDVYISGAGHVPPTPNEMYNQIKIFYSDLLNKSGLNSIELAAWTHAEFVKIHPFIDGNGRTARLIMNYQLMANEFLPISIAKEDRLEYFNALEAYAVDGDLSLLADMIANLEERQLDIYINLN